MIIYQPQPAIKTFKLRLINFQFSIIGLKSYFLKIQSHYVEDVNPWMF